MLCQLNTIILCPVLMMVPSALEQVQGKQIFTKHDLHSAYNLDYLAMSYDLVNASILVSKSFLFYHLHKLHKDSATG